MEGPTLEFDENIVDTQLAQEYLKEHENDFKSVRLLSDLPPKTKLVPNDHRSEDRMRKAVEMMEKLKQNSLLLAQLEYLRRNNDIRDTINYDLKILEKAFSLYYMSSAARRHNGNPVFRMSKDAPMFVLGTVIARNSWILACDEESLPICFLFTALCREVGLSIELARREDRGVQLDEDNRKWEGACVVTERCDLDSAAAALLGWPTKYPWSLRRVWVQESVQQNFKNILLQKCKDKNDAIDAKYQSSAQVLHKKDKSILLEYVGNPEDVGDDVIVVESYRTTKELLGLPQKNRVAYLSLWSRDISEANEIAHNMNAVCTWINGAARFDGPAKIAGSIYTNTVSKKCDNAELPHVKKLREAWIKKSITERTNIIVKVIESLKSHANEVVKRIVNDIQYRLFDDDGFVDVGNSGMCVGLIEPRGVIALSQVNVSIDDDVVADLIISVLKGNAILYDSLSNDVFAAFNDGTIPILPVNKFKWSDDGEDVFKILYPGICGILNRKVIWYNYGTIFAN